MARPKRYPEELIARGVRIALIPPGESPMGQSASIGRTPARDVTAVGPLGHERCLVSIISGNFMQLADFAVQAHGARSRVVAGLSRAFEGCAQLSENRGVPGSSPGLAIRKAIHRLDFLFRSGSCIGHGSGHATAGVLTSESGSPVVPGNTANDRACSPS
jgi:hypothetical protein